MKQHDPACRPNAAYALLTVMLFIFVASALVATITSGSLQRAFIARKLADRMRAQSLAEAATYEAYAVLSSNFASSASDSNFPAKSFGGGTYNATVSTVNQQVAVISSIGAFNGTEEICILDVVDLHPGGGGSAPPSWTPSGYTVLVGGTIDWTGDSEFIGGGGVHCGLKFGLGGNGSLQANCSSSAAFEMKGNSCGVNGNVNALTFNGRSQNVTGTITRGPVASIDIPDIELDGYANVASNNTEVYNSSVTLSSAYTPRGNIMWVNGSLNIAGNADFHGCFIATGDIQVSGNGSITKVDNYPLLVSKHGSIKIAGAKTLTGLIYVATRDYDQTGCNTLHGQIIVKGNFKKAGTSAIYEYVDSPVTAPGGGGGQWPTVGVTAWQR